MGAYLSSPSLDKNTSNGSSVSPVNSTTLEWGASDMQGWRKTMEDAHITSTDLGDGNMCFAVFDGHGGSGVARFVPGCSFHPTHMHNEEFLVVFCVFCASFLRLVSLSRRSFCRRCDRLLFSCCYVHDFAC